MNENIKEYLCHMTDAEKKAYNAEYYRNHKNYWQDYYSKGQTVGRPTARQKYVTEGGNGVKRRGYGLNDYSAIASPNGYNRRVGNQHTPSTPFTAEIEAHNPSFTPKPSNRPGVSAQVNAEAFDETYKKAEKKQKVKKATKQAYSDWNSGAKSIAKTAANSVNSGKKALSSLLAKFK